MTDYRNPMYWGGPTYPDYLVEAKSKKGESERRTSERAETERGQREFNVVHQYDELGKQSNTISQFEGDDVTKTPMYKRTLAMGLDDTSRAFNNVRTQRTARARMAGFGNEQPIKQADDTMVDSMQAEEEGRLPLETAEMVTPFALDAASQRAGIAGAFQGDAAMYNGSSNQNMALTADLETKRMERRAKMWKRLAGVGMLAAAPFTGGATAAALVSGGGSSIANS